MSLYAASHWYQGADGVVFEHCRKARKEHMCNVCRSQIEPGDNYRAVWSPEWFTAALHTSCADLIDQLAKQYGYTSSRTWNKSSS